MTHKQLPMERWQDVDKAAISEWNTRPQLLTKEQIEALERMKEE